MAQALPFILTMKTTTIIVMIILATGIPVSARPQLEILSPPEHTGTKLDHLYLVGRTDAPLVEVRLNGELVRAVAVRDSIFHTMLSFGYGLNVIAVTAVVFGNAADSTAPSDTVEILCGPVIENNYGRLFTPFIFHQEQPRPECLACHQRPASGRQNIDDAEWCYECHGEIRRRFQTHISDDRRACINCHRLEPDLTLISTGSYADKNPCYLCHQDKIGQYAQDYIHGPVAGGMCTICHDPHGSDFEKSLVEPVPVLCPSCHTMAEGRGLPVRHRPYADGRCTECHDPHSTDYKWVLVKNSQELCIKCHQEIGSLKNHKHPYNVIPKRPLLKSLKLSDKGELECISCHEPHAGAAVHLLRTEQDNACAGCHPDR